MRNAKKAQLAVLIIVSVIILVGFIFLISTSSKADEKTLVDGSPKKFSTTDVESVEIYIEDVLKNVLTDAMLAVSKEDYTSYVQSHFIQELNLQEVFPNLKITEFNDLEIRTDISEDETYVIAEATYPLVIEYNGKTSNIDSFYAQAPVKAERKIVTDESGALLASATIVSMEGDVILEIPSGIRLSNPDIDHINVEFDTDSPDDELYFKIEPAEITLNKPVEVTVDFSGIDFSGKIDKNYLSIVKVESNGVYTAIKGSTVNTITGEIRTPISEFGTYAVKMDPKWKCINEGHGWCTPDWGTGTHYNPEVYDYQGFGCYSECDPWKDLR